MKKIIIALLAAFGCFSVIADPLTYFKQCILQDQDFAPVIFDCKATQENITRQYVGLSFFDFNGHQLSLFNQKTIDSVIVDIPSTASVYVYGHTDAVGSTQFNQNLGMMRAAAVASYLMKKGVAVTDIISLGESQLLINTTEQEPKNRRVDIYIEYTITHLPKQ